MTPETPSHDELVTAQIASLTIAVLTFPLLLWLTDEGNARFIAYAVLFVVLLPVSVVVQRRISQRRFEAGGALIAAAAGIGLIMLSIDSGVLMGAFLGALGGILAGAALALRVRR
jgi:hypothetical protein